MRYVDGFVLPVPKKNLKAYLRMARMGERLWRKHGALDYKECVGDDLKTKWGTPFGRVMKLKPGETVVFSYIVFKSRAHRDRVNAKVMEAMPSMGGPKDMPFDMKRMVYGGFNVSVGGSQQHAADGGCAPQLMLSARPQGKRFSNSNIDLPPGRTF
jgi:uncharacterized protein YbaA (DUF1428 family)